MKKIQKKDYATKEAYYNAYFAEHWWQTLIIYTLTTIVIELILRFFERRETFVAILFIYVSFSILFIGTTIAEKRKNGHLRGGPWVMLILHSVCTIICLISTLFI